MKIQPKNLNAAPKIGVEITIIPIIRDLNAPTCTIQYTIFSEDEEMLENERFELTEAEYAGWGYDNAYIENIVLVRLGLQREV